MTPMKFLRANWERAGACLSILAGALTLLIGYQRISDANSVSDQLPYIISGGLLGIFLLGLGGLLWVSADLRDEWRELWMIRDALVRLAAGQSGAAGGSIAAWFDDISGADDEVVAAGGSRRRRADEQS
jgi:hypothetical protein